MRINVNVKRTFKVNGKEYNSFEEMPVDIREAFEKAVGHQTDAGNLPHPAPMRTKIIFNGTEYQSIAAMPQDVRQLYERVIESAETGVEPSEIDIAGISSGGLSENETVETIHKGDTPRPTKTETSFSPLALIISAIVVALILLLYSLFHSRG